MEIIKTISELRKKVDGYKKTGKKIGFVPTMGYLHEGHMSLVKKAGEKSDIVISSIFVNPIQFGPNEDFEKYPRDIIRDEKLLIEAGCDILFYPDAQEMYLSDFSTFVEVKGVQDNLCGDKRPGHFIGVATVVIKLLNIVKPDIAVFGIKDAQQVRVIEKMAADLNIDVEIVRGDIIREADGLAMSSRNTYLNTEERREALALSKGLAVGKGLIEAGERDAGNIINGIRNYITGNYSLPVIDYIKAVDFKNMKDISEIEGEVLVAIAAFVGKTRLIDNFIISIE